MIEGVVGNMKVVQPSGFAAARTLPPVRRYLVIFLLVLLPAQFSWAVVGQYCGHETGAQSEHLGHHSHEHEQSHAVVAQSEALDTEDASQGAIGGMHADCHSCHASCGVAVPTPLVYPELAGAAQRPDGPSHAVGMHLVERPDRPQWLYSRAPV